MNILGRHITKPLALLAALLLLVQQSLPASCCCRHDHNEVRSTAVWTTSCCRTDTKLSCCSSAAESQHSCCQTDWSDDDTKPCRCPFGCCGLDKPTAVDASPITLIGASELSDIAVTSSLFDVPLFESDRTRSEQSSVISFSGVRLCARLCRFTI